MKISKFFVLFVVAALTASFFVSCDNPEYASPKPKGYFRIDLPEHSYRKLDTARIPFTCDYATIAEYSAKDTAGNIWIHITYPQQHAALEMTYLPVRDNLRAGRGEHRRKDIQSEFGHSRRRLDSGHVGHCGAYERTGRDRFHRAGNPSGRAAWKTSDSDAGKLRI